MITIHVTTKDSTLMRSYEQITINESSIVFSTPNKDTRNECKLGFEKGLLNSITVTEETEGVYNASSKVTTHMGVAASIGGYALGMYVTTYETLKGKLEGVQEKELLKAKALAKHNERNQQSLFKGRQKAPQRTQADLKAAVAKQLQAQGLTDKQKAQEELQKSVLAKFRKDNARDGETLVKSLEGKEVEILKCAASGTEEYNELIEMIKGERFSNDVFSAFGEILSMKNMQECVKAIRAFSSKITRDENGIIIFKA